ncbi:hypothetical protein FKM82_005436 [Ascaphus truei]
MTHNKVHWQREWGQMATMFIDNQTRLITDLVILHPPWVIQPAHHRYYPKSPPTVPAKQEIQHQRNWTDITRLLTRTTARKHCPHHSVQIMRRSSSPGSIWLLPPPPGAKQS